MRQLKITKQITNREYRSLDRYLQEIGSVEMITAEEEVELAIRIKEGDEQALERLVNANLRFVVSVAKQYQNQGLTLGDLINEGNVGLIKAAQRFDETRGFKFISYAVWWIRQSILQALAEQSRIVRLPLNRIGALSKVNRAAAELEQRFEREPSVEEIAHLLETSAEYIEEFIHNSARHVSLDAPINNADEEGTLLSVMINEDEPNPDAALIKDSLKSELHLSMKILNEREKEILVCFFGLNNNSEMSLEEIGFKMGLTRERVRQIKDLALKRLKKSSRMKLLRLYL
jgi:RNA polymerase primary sigma factor